MVINYGRACSSCLETPDDHLPAIQTVLLGASSDPVVEFVVPDEGEDVLVDHGMNDAYRGAAGVLLAEASTPWPPGSHAANGNEGNMRTPRTLNGS